jgi:hypothetical protein
MRFVATASRQTEKVTTRSRPACRRSGAGEPRQYLLLIVGGKPALGPDGDPNAHSDPLPGFALKYGHYAPDEKGWLKPEYEGSHPHGRDHDRALSFGHSTHQEIRARELMDKLNFKRAFIDHPFSPFVNVTVEQMKQLSKVGIHFNFTYDELSPMLGVDPAKMYQAIRSVGVEHFTLSSDAGDTVFPNSVDHAADRGWMAFGITGQMKLVREELASCWSIDRGVAAAKRAAGCPTGRWIDRRTPWAFAAKLSPRVRCSGSRQR